MLGELSRRFKNRLAARWSTRLPMRPSPPPMTGGQRYFTNDNALRRMGDSQRASWPPDYTHEQLMLTLGQARKGIHSFIDDQALHHGRRAEVAQQQGAYLRFKHLT